MFLALTQHNWQSHRRHSKDKRREKQIAALSQQNLLLIITVRTSCLLASSLSAPNWLPSPSTLLDKESSGSSSTSVLLCVTPVIFVFLAHFGGLGKCLPLMCTTAVNARPHLRQSSRAGSSLGGNTSYGMVQGRWSPVSGTMVYKYQIQSQFFAITFKCR